MKFLIDAQLPRRIVKWLESEGHDAIHTLDLPDGNSTKDQAIITLAEPSQQIARAEMRDKFTEMGSLNPPPTPGQPKARRRRAFAERKATLNPSAMQLSVAERFPLVESVGSRPADAASMLTLPPFDEFRPHMRPTTDAISCPSSSRIASEG